MNCDKIKQKTAGIVNYNRWQEEYDESVKSSDTCSGKRDTNEVGSAEGDSYHRGKMSGRLCD